MFKLLNEINTGYYNLTDNQKQVLLICAVSATPTQAFETTTGDYTLVVARNTLAILGFIQVANNEVILTQKGQEALINYNLIDDSGQPTEDSMKLLEPISSGKADVFQ